jgi:pyruvate/2-oxoglutarate dehydrogenase complex dihydrolipoamide acyltransferase (E2) component
MSRNIPVVVPQMNPNDEHAVLVKWHAAPGEQVAAGQKIATMETSKAAFDVEAPSAGYLFFDAEPKSLIAVGARLAWVCDENAPPPAEEAAAAPAAKPSGGGARQFTRKALQLMQRHGLHEDAFGADAGRVEVADVERVLRNRAAQPQAATAAAEDADLLEQSPAKLLEIQALGEVQRQAVPSLVALAIAGAEVDETLRRHAAAHGPVSLLEVAIYEAARLLPDFPELNGYHDGGRAWRYRTVSIGFAMNLGRSLRVPVVRDAGRLSLLEIARAVRSLSLAYMREELQMADLSGGTFTVTDLSMHGAEYFVPVVNRRQSAILGICAEQAGDRRRNLVLAFDHRMADGMRGAAFLAALRDRLREGPAG